MKSAKLSQKILITVIGALLFVCGSVLTYFLISLDRKTEAFSSSSQFSETSNAVVIDELWNGSKTSGSFNGSRVRTLVQMLSNNTNGNLSTISSLLDGATANFQGIKMINATNLREYDQAGNVGGKSIVVTLGGFKWIVTCLSKDTSGNIVATLLQSNVTEGKCSFCYCSHMGSINNLKNPLVMYGLSYIRAFNLNNGGSYAYVIFDDDAMGNIEYLNSVTSTITHSFGAFTHSSGAFYNYIVQPNQVPYQRVSQGNNNYSGYIFNNESLATNLTGFENNYTFQNNQYYTAWGADKLWLPSVSETGYGGGDSLNNYEGIWKLSVAEKSSSADYWSRSSGCTRSPADIKILPTLHQDYLSFDETHFSHAVRPAFHLNLTKLVNEMAKTVTLDQQSGTGGAPSVTAWVGDVMPTITVPTRTGYTFGGYFTGANGTGEQYYLANGTSQKTFTGSPTTLYAKWTINTYTITYNGNGNTSGSTANSTHSYNTAQALTANGYTKTGYNFTGWATSAGGVVVYSNGQSVTNLTTENGAVITLYAKWAPITYTITYNGNGATSGSTASSNHTYDTAQTLTTNSFARVGYMFAGWATTALGGVSYSNGQSVINLTSAHGDTVNLYAVWTPITYTIQYHGNGNTGGSTASSTHTYDVEKYLSENGFNKIGYHFLGWARSPAGDIEYFYSDSVVNLTTTNGDTINLYAKWTANNYTVTFEYNGATGGNSVANKSVIFDSPYGDLPEPTKAGYNFDGWYLESNFATKVTSTTMISTADDHTLYAKWKSWVVIHAVGSAVGFDYQANLYEADNLGKVTITPQTNYYVSEFSIDNATYLPTKYYYQAIGKFAFGNAFCSTNDTSNKIYFSFDCLDLGYLSQNQINIYIKFAAGTNTNLKDPGGSAEGVNVTATYGGKVSMIGDDFENLADSDTVTFVADVCVDGYKFSHWENSAGEHLGTDDSIRLAKSVVMNDIIKAVFVPIDNSLINGDKNNTN